MKTKFIVKFPIKKEYKKEFLIFKKEFDKKAEDDFTEKEGSKNAKNLAKKAIREDFKKIIFVGGNGILNEGVNGIMETTGGDIPPDFIIGIVPTGSGNNFAKTLGISKDIKKAFEIIKRQKTTLVDIGRANERFFVNCVSFGFDALINKIADNLKERYQFLPKEGSYLLAAIKEVILKIPTFKVQIKGNGLDYKGKIILIAITNGPSYGAIFKINPGASINDGKLNICIIEPVGKIRALADIYRATKGTHVNLSEVKMLKFSSLILSSPEPLSYEMDGEVLDPKREYKINIFPKFLKILVP